MEESKSAAKAFVDMHFPVKQTNPLKSDVLDSIFPPNKHVPEDWKKQGSAVQIPKVQNSTPADANSQGSHNKSQDTSQKGSRSVFVDASNPCHMGSSVDYGCRDYYPSSKKHPGGYDKEKDRKDGYDYPDPENSRGEWWQGSLYY
ncbi:uncharacterized protein M6B38_370755 [Iris pallida]|uniref:Uncharacterized protein n=1 Tax=Iris pallida TaxID=29817 RepID=A0AAX6GEU8_IRIPA|nr:Uncharacterized protein M6B38_227620 [Iris pallida]KAJ6826788.1 uncharacterized protein M6B38_370755 [Iris pallida]